MMTLKLIVNNKEVKKMAGLTKHTTDSQVDNIWEAPTVAIPIPSNALIATPEIQAIHDEYVQLDKQIKMFEKRLKELRKPLEEYMGDHQELLNLDGTIGITWKYNKPSIVLNTDLLKLNFPTEYQLCLEEKKGNRVFKVE